MYIHTMATKVAGATKAAVTEILKDGGRIKLSGSLGNGDPFVASPMLRPLQREISGPELVAFREFVAVESGGKAPALDQRDADIFAWLDKNGWGVTSFVAPEPPEEE